MLTSPRFPARLVWPWYIPSRSRPTWPEAGLGSRGPVKETSLSYSSNLHLNISRPTFSSGMTCFSKGGVCGVITKVLIPFSYSVQISSHRQEKEEKNGSLCPLPSALLALCSLQHAYGHKINLRCELKLTSESDYIYQVISATKGSFINGIFNAFHRLEFCRSLVLTEGLLITRPSTNVPWDTFPPCTSSKDDNPESIEVFLLVAHLHLFCYYKAFDF